jgi:hypothetical protein
LDGLPSGVIAISLHACNGYEYGYKGNLDPASLRRLADKCEEEEEGSSLQVGHYNLINYVTDGSRIPMPCLLGAHHETSLQKQARHKAIERILQRSRKNKL